jgi:uncharacterized protein YeeX (DUF496 family)
MKARWQYLFENKIINRGMGYFDSDAIVSLKKTDNDVDAIVGGMHDYNVRIRLVGNEIVGMGCTCPYGEYNHCKHMAAVVLQLEDESGSELYFDDDTYGAVDVFEEMHEDVYKFDEILLDDFDLEEVINSTDRDILNKFVYDVIIKNGELKNQFLMQLDNLDDDMKFKLLCETIDMLIKKFKTDYHDEEGYFAEIYIMDDYLLKEVNILFTRLLKKEKYVIVFIATAYFMEKIQYCHYHNEEVNLEMYSRLCERFWKSIYEKCDEMEFKQLYEWMLLYEPRIIEPILRRVVDSVLSINKLIKKTKL